MIKLRLIYLLCVLLLFFIEVMIAIGRISGGFVRENIGDILVIILIYFMLRLVFNVSPKRTAVISIIIGFIAEVMQFIHLAELIGFEKGSIFYIVIGNTFSFLDLGMYLIGGIVAVVIDRYLLLLAFSKQKSSS